LRPSRRNSRKAQRFDSGMTTPKTGLTARAVVQWFRDSGCSNPEIEKRTHLSHSFVHRWSNRKDARTGPGRGRTPVIGEQLGAKLANVVRKKRFKSANKLRAKVVNPKTCKMVCCATVCAALKKQGLTSVKVLRCQKLGGLDKERRLAWCKKMRGTKVGWERQWMFTDEKWFNVGGIQGHETMWVDANDLHPDERYVGKRAHPTKIHVWAGITWDGRMSLHKGTWPPHSLDLNPIETLSVPMGYIRVINFREYLG
jgi:transposase